MAIYSVNGRGEEHATTTVRIPAGLYDAARREGINFSRTLADALAAKVTPPRV